MNIYNGVVNIYKERDWTSHDVAAAVKGVLRTKTGHTGTLDPEATGVLPICIGTGTKLYDMISGGTKVYTCKCMLGAATDTQDATGRVVFEGTPPNDAGVVERELMMFAEGGGYEQTPPMYSAVKIGGRRLYDMARRGDTVHREPRFVLIKNISIIDIELPSIMFRVECGKGTYIRAICDDLGKRLGCGAYMDSLVRNRVGIFDESKAITVDNFRKLANDGRTNEAIMTVEDILLLYKDEKKW